VRKGRGVRTARESLQRLRPCRFDVCYDTAEPAARQKPTLISNCRRAPLGATGIGPERLELKTGQVGGASYIAGLEDLAEEIKEEAGEHHGNG
jgi:hypothetical protein